MVRAVASESHWQRWHRAYEDPRSALSRRLAVVQRQIAGALDAAPPGTVRLVSLCAGQGRDVIGALRDHPRRHEVVARLVELDPALAQDGRVAAHAAGLPGVDVVTGDASDTSAYEGAVPAQVIVACGIFGNIAAREIRSMVPEFGSLAAPGAVVIWTRHRRSPDLTPSVRTWFAEDGFEEVAFDGDESRAFGVGVHRLVADPLPFRPGRRMFEFRGDGVSAALAPESRTVSIRHPK